MAQRLHVYGSKFSAWLGAQFRVEEDGSVTTRLALTELQEGPPNHIHGGVLAALLDEAMGAAAWYAGHKCVSVNLNFNYKQPVPPGVEVDVRGRLERIEGRKAFTSGIITLASGEVAVEGTGIWVEVAHLPEDSGFQFGPTPDEPPGRGIC